MRIANDLRYGGSGNGGLNERVSLLGAATGSAPGAKNTINVNVDYMKSSKSSAGNGAKSNNIIRDNNSKSKVNPLLNIVQNNIRRKSTQGRSSTSPNRQKACESDLNSQPLNSVKYIASEVKVLAPPIDKKVFLTDDIRLPMTEFIYILEFLDLKSRMRLLLTKKTLRHWRMYVNAQRHDDGLHNKNSADCDILNTSGINESSFDNNSILSYDSDGSYDSSQRNTYPSSMYYHFDGRKLRNHILEHRRTSKASTTISFNSVINSVNVVPKKRQVTRHSVYGSIFDSSIDDDIDVAYDNLYSPLPLSALDVERGSGVFVPGRRDSRAVSLASVVFSCLFARSSLYEQPFVLLSSVGVVVTMIVVAAYVLLCNLLHLSAGIAVSVIALLVGIFVSALYVYTRRSLD